MRHRGLAWWLGAAIGTATVVLFAGRFSHKISAEIQGQRTGAGSCEANSCAAIERGSISAGREDRYFDIPEAGMLDNRFSFKNGRDHRITRISEQGSPPAN